MLVFVLKKIDTKYLVLLNNKIFYCQFIFSNKVFKNNFSKNYFYFLFVLKILYRFGLIPLYNKNI